MNSPCNLLQPISASWVELPYEPHLGIRKRLVMLYQHPRHRNGQVNPHRCSNVSNLGSDPRSLGPASRPEHAREEQRPQEQVASWRGGAVAVFGRGRPRPFATTAHDVRHAITYVPGHPRQDRHRRCEVCNLLV